MNENQNVDNQDEDQLVFSDPHDSSHYRLIRPDGTFNIERKGRVGGSLYETVMAMSWPQIIGSFLLLYFAFNCIFALLFMALGPDTVQGLQGETWTERYVQMIYFSIQTFTTVGYGHLSPQGNAASLLAAFVAFIGLISFAILTGLSFAKFSKPTAHILFSEQMLIAPNPHKNMEPSLQFRIVNATNNQIIDLQARVTLAWLEKEDGIMRRRFQRLDLQMENIHLFPLNWTLVHHLDEDSPLKGQSVQNLMDKQMEVLVFIKGFDDTYSQIIHSKRSYSCSDLVEGARFTPMYENTKSQTILNLSKVSDYESYTF